MLSVSNLRYHCRTCLNKLEFSDDIEETKILILIRHFPDIEQLMCLCLADGLSASEDAADCLDKHMPYICHECLGKWKDLTRLFHLARESDKKLKQVLDKEAIAEHRVLKHGLEEGGLENEIYISPEKTEDFFSEIIEKYETTSPFYRTSRSNTPNLAIENIKVDGSAPSVCDGNSLSPKPKWVNSSGENTAICDNKDPTQNYKKTNMHQIAKLASLHSRIKKRRTKKSLKVVVDEESEKHVTAANKRAHFRCLPCKKYFYEIRKYEAHVKAVHEGAKKPYQCKQCDKAYKFHKTLIDHIALNHSDKPLETYKCEMCNNLFKTQITLKTHIQNKHRDADAESLRIICDQCGFLAVNHISLKKHIKNRHTAAEELKCDECPKVFKNQYYLKYHKLNFHNPSNIKPFQCTDCNMAFTRQSLLNTHKRSHLDIAERIKCDFEGCEVRFLQQAEKRRHMRLVHLKVKQYVCDICGSAFGTKPTLRHHRYIHTNEKPYECNVCGQGFRQRSAMKTHSKVHAVKQTVDMVCKTMEGPVSAISAVNLLLN